jgi:phosphatidylserine/phosphatidylglycerophosphate/cardiolipin synthase-like enzyme
MVPPVASNSVNSASTPTSIAKSERERNDILASRFLKTFKQALDDKDPAKAVHILSDFHGKMVTTTEGISAPLAKKVRELIEYGHKWGVDNNDRALWKFIAIITLGLTYLFVDRVHESDPERLVRLTERHFYQLKPRPMTKELSDAVASGDKLAQTFRHLPATGTGVAMVRRLDKNVTDWSADYHITHLARGKGDRILSSTFIADGIFARAKLGMLLTAARNGVEVEILRDYVGGLSGKETGFVRRFNGRDYLDELEEAGAKAYIFNPPTKMLSKIGKLAMVARSHKKILAVEYKGKTQEGVVATQFAAKVGGRNEDTDYLADPKDHAGAWRDSGVAVFGPGAQAAFESGERELRRTAMVNRVGKERLGNWVKRDAELIGASIMMDEWMKWKEPLPSDWTRADVVKELVRRAVSELPKRGVGRKLSSREMDHLRKDATDLSQLMETKGSIDAWQDVAEHEATVSIIDKSAAGPDTAPDNLVPSFAALIKAALGKFLDQNPYLVPTEDMMKASAASAYNGMQVTSITNSPKTTDSDLTQALFWAVWPYIMARVPNSKIGVLLEGAKVHAKRGVIGDAVSFDGSTNRDFLSMETNAEASYVIYSKPLATEMTDEIHADMQKQRVFWLEIKRDGNGRAVLDKNGDPIITAGPDQFLSKKEMEKYTKISKKWEKRIDRNDLLKPLRLQDLASALMSDPKVAEAIRKQLVIMPEWEADSFGKTKE